MNQAEQNVLGESFYKTLLDSIFDAVYAVDIQMNIVYWNHSCERLTGYTASEMIGRSLAKTSFFSQRDPDQEAECDQSHHSGMEIILQTGVPGTWKGTVQRKNGQRIPIQSHISAIHNHKGLIVGAAEVFRDISALMWLEDTHRQLVQLSRKDQLTGLYNRGAISEILKTEIQRSHRYKLDLSVVMVDIDYFKRINDRYGHDMGDKVLAKVASILSYYLRSPDVVGRWGGEEFLIVVPNGCAASAVQLSERMREMIKSITESDRPEEITASFGVAQHQEKQGADRLIYLADMALYQAKRQGRDRVVSAESLPSEEMKQQ